MKNNNKYIIYQPAKSAMQSGTSKSKKWCLINTGLSESFNSSEFGWNGTTNPEKKIQLFFKTLEEAKRFASKNQYEFTVVEAQKRKILKKSYAENFIKRK